MNFAKTNKWQIFLVVVMVIIAVVWLTASRSASIPVSPPSGPVDQSNPIIIDQSQGQLPMDGGASLQQSVPAGGAAGSSVNPQQSSVGL